MPRRTPGIFRVSLLVCLAFCSPPAGGWRMQPDAAATAAERTAFSQINAHRASKGLPALAWSDVIAEQARRHSREMASGETPRGHAGYEARMAAIAKHIRFNSAAENVVGDRDVEAAVRRLLLSPVHRKNIEEDFDLTGVGAATGGDGLLYLTQIFVKTE